MKIKKMNNQKGTGIVVVIAVVAVVALLVWWVGKSGYKVPEQSSGIGIVSAEDLDNLEKELDSTNIDQIDGEIKQLETESSNF